MSSARALRIAVRLCAVALLARSVETAEAESPKRTYGPGRSPVTWTSRDKPRAEQQTQDLMSIAAQVLGGEKLPEATRAEYGELHDEYPFNERMDGRSFWKFSIPSVEITLPAGAPHPPEGTSRLLLDINLVIDDDTHEFLLAYTDSKATWALPYPGAKEIDWQSEEITGAHISPLGTTPLKSTVREILAVFWSLGIDPASQGQVILRPRLSDIAWPPKVKDGVVLPNADGIRPFWIIQVLGAEYQQLRAENNSKILVQIEDRDHKNYLVRSMP